MRIRASLFVGALIVLVVTAAAVSRATDSISHANSIGELFVAGVNTESSEVRLTIVKQIYDSASIQEIGEEKLIGLFGRLLRDFGELKHHHSEIVGNYLHLYAQSAMNSQWRDFQFQLGSGKTRKLLRIVFIAEVTEPVYLPNGNIDDPFTLNWLNGYIDRLASENDLAASMLLARGDSIFFERNIGFADLARLRPVDSATRFNLGSGNKMFTALVSLQLISPKMF